jgi:hypothetical protein
MRLEDPTDNDGLGWRRMTREELVHNLCIWLKVMPRWKRSGFGDRNALKSDEAARRMAEDIADRLKSCPMFTAARVPVYRGMGSFPPGDERRGD